MKKPTITIKRVDFYHLKSGLNNKVTAAGDMLRYDIAFMSHEWPDLVAFPTFHKKGLGTYGGKPTTARWRSFLLALEPAKCPDEFTESVPWLHDHADDFYTYRNERGDFRKVTLREYLDAVN